MSGRGQERVVARSLGSIGIRPDSKATPTSKFSCMRCGLGVKRPKGYFDNAPVGALCKDCDSLRDPLISAWRGPSR